MNINEIEKEDQIDFSGLIRPIKPYIFHIVVVGMIFSLLAFLLTKLIIKPVYESSVMLLVNNRKVENQPLTNDEINSAKSLAALYTIVIKSDSVLQPVIEVTNSTMTTGQLSEKISVNAVNNTQVIKISVKDNDPEMALRYTTEITNIAPQVILSKVEAGSVNILAEPTFPTSPISPNVKKNVVLGFVLGVGISVGYIILLSLIDRTIKSEEDIENKVGLKVIGVIPNIESLRS